MSKRTIFTEITPLPSGITRASVLSTLHDHTEMIDLQPLVLERHPIKPPSSATPEEYHCQWYSLTDRVAYLPGGLATGQVSYNVCFHNLATGMQSHVYAPLGLIIKNKWTLGGSLPNEPREAVEMGLGVPKEGLWLREDVDMRCNILMTAFVRKTLKRAHKTLVARLVEKAHLNEAERHNAHLRAMAESDTNSISSYTPSSPGFPPPLFLSPNPHRSVSSMSRSQSSRASYHHSPDLSSGGLPPGYQVEPSGLAEGEAGMYDAAGGPHRTQTVTSTYSRYGGDEGFGQGPYGPSVEAGYTGALGGGYTGALGYTKSNARPQGVVYGEPGATPYGKAGLAQEKEYRGGMVEMPGRVERDPVELE